MTCPVCGHYLKDYLEYGGSLDNITADIQICGWCGYWKGYRHYQYPSVKLRIHSQ